MSGIIPDAFASTINGVSGISGSLSSMLYGGSKEASPTSPAAHELKKDPFVVFQEEVQDTMRRVREHDSNLENIQSEVFGASQNDLRIRAFVQKVREEVRAIRSKQEVLEKRVHSGFMDLEDRILHVSAMSARSMQDGHGHQGGRGGATDGRLGRAAFGVPNTSPSAHTPRDEDTSGLPQGYRTVVEDTQQLKDMCGKIDSRLEKARDDFERQKVQLKALSGSVRECNRRYDNREEIEQEYKAMQKRFEGIQVQKRDVLALEAKMREIEPVWRNTKKRCEEILDSEPANQKDVDSLQSRLEEAVRQHQHLQEAVCGAASQREVDVLHARLEEVQQTTLSNLQGQIDAMLKANDGKSDKDLAEVQARLEAFVSQIEHAFELFYEEQGSFKKAKVAFDLRIGALEGRLSELGLVVRDTSSTRRLV